MNCLTTTYRPTGVLKIGHISNKLPKYFLSPHLYLILSTSDGSSLMILGVTGFIGSGKDTIADYLCTFHGFQRLSFAASLKDAVSSVFGWDRELLEGTTKSSREWREQVDEWWSDRLGMEVTPRRVLQYWGTEVCRNGFHQDIWVASVENKLRSSDDNIVITDARFQNELRSIKSVGGTTIRVHRGPEPVWYEAAINYNKGPDGNMCWALGKAVLDRNHVHASEYSSVGLKYDYHLDNNETLHVLYKKVDDILSLL